MIDAAFPEFRRTFYEALVTGGHVGSRVDAADFFSGVARIDVRQAAQGYAYVGDTMVSAEAAQNLLALHRHMRDAAREGHNAGLYLELV